MLSQKRHQKVERLFVFALTLWASSVYVLSYFDFFRRIPLSLIALFVIAGIIALIALNYASESFSNYFNSISYKHLTIFNIWRIPAGAAFLYYGANNWLPEQFVINAGYGDLVIGCLVPVILMLPESWSKYFAFHVFGMLDFVLAVGTGLVFTILQVPLMENIAGNPIVLIPLFGVPVTGAFHILTLRRLWREGNIIRNSEKRELSKNLLTQKQF